MDSPFNIFAFSENSILGEGEKFKRQIGTYFDREVWLKGNSTGYARIHITGNHMDMWTTPLGFLDEPEIYEKRCPGISQELYDAAIMYLEWVRKQTDK